MKTLLVAFGDSWTFGSELDRPQDQSWAVQLADKLNAEHINLGTPASSIGYLMVQLFDFIRVADQYQDYKKIFMVGMTGTSRYLSYSNELDEFISITPEADYRTEDIHPSGRPPDTVSMLKILSVNMYKHVQCNSYDSFLAAQTIFSFQNYCKNHNIDCLFFSYFGIPELIDYRDIIDLNTVHNKTITKELTGQEYRLPDIRNNRYFKDKLFHPNLIGHSEIAKILNELYTKKYPRN
jgi:hypothetical protein